MDLNALQTFLEVADRGSFSAAGAALGLPTSTVSRRIARLEDALELALVRRKGRTVELTEDGDALARRARGPMTELGEVEHGFAAQAGVPRGELTVSAPIDLGATPFLADILASYRTRYDAVRVQLTVANQRVDLIEHNIDVAFRLHATPLPPADHLIARRLGHLSFALYASPSYAHRRGLPDTWGAVAQHDILAHSQAYTQVWPHQPVARANDFHPLRAMAIAGMGVTGLPAFLAEPALDHGELVRCPVAWSGPRPSLSLVWLRSRHLAPRLRAFIDQAVEHCRSVAWLQS